MAKITKRQEEAIGFMVMWANDFHAAIHFDYQVDLLDFYAKMAVDHCQDLGLDVDKVLGSAMRHCAERYTSPTKLEDVA